MAYLHYNTLILCTINNLLFHRKTTIILLLKMYLGLHQNLPKYSYIKTKINSGFLVVLNHLNQLKRVETWFGLSSKNLLLLFNYCHFIAISLQPITVKQRVESQNVV